MPVPTTNVSFGSIQSEFGGSNPISLSSEYYRGGPNVPIGTATSVTDGVPIPTSASTLIRVGMFRGLSLASLAGSTTTGIWSCESSKLDPEIPSISITIYADGTGIGQSESGFPDGIANWYNPTTAGIGNSYWVRATVTASSGTAAFSGATGTWLALTTNRQWSFSTTVYNTATRTLTFEFSTSSSGSPIVATHTNNLMRVTRDF